MLNSIVLPWWAALYLAAVIGLFFLSFVSKRSDRKSSEIISSALSVVTICVFVIGYFNLPIVNMLGFLMLPMTAVGLWWEFTRAVKETARAQEELGKESDLSDSEQSFLLNTAIGVNALLVVPGYMTGVILSCRVLGII